MRKVLDSFYLACGVAGGIFLVLIAGVILYQVFGRNLGYGIPGVDDLAALFLVASAFLALAPTLRELELTWVCCGVDYPKLVEGEADYALYRGTKPWDHAPGALIVREAGGVVRHPDGRDYDVMDRRESTLLSPDPETWARARAALFG